MNNLSLNIKNKIAILEINQPDSKVNVLNTETMRELEQVIAGLANKERSEVEVLIITSKKNGIFIAGADIKEIESIVSAEEAQDKAEKGKEILSKLEKLDLLTVAVINGACLGGGFELVLACDYRVASFSNKIKIGLPEVKLGVIPGFGGTQRLPRLVGLTRALTMILAGQVVSGKNALRYGMIDKLFPETRLLEESIDFANGILGGKVHVKRGKKKKVVQMFLEDTPIGRSIVSSRAKKNVIKKTKGLYPAPLKAIDLIKKTYRVDINKGFSLESKVFSELAITAESKNLIKVFYLYEEYKKFTWVENNIKPGAINKCGILGAGIMGGGIAQLVSFNDIPVRIKDIAYDALKTALKTANKLFKYVVKKRKIKEPQAQYKLGLISPTVTYEGFGNADLVIEAVVEDLSIKQKVFKELSGIVSEKTILASNTSTLPIINMAEATSSPDKVIGLHFFNPVHRMPLVEVIKSSKTSEETAATVIAFARKLGKLVIVVKDVPGFLINRILLAYLNEAGFLVGEGVGIKRIDEIARKFGMPMGPIELIDEVGIDVGYKVAKILEDYYGDRMKVCPVLEKIKSKGLLGKKDKKGFYIYNGKKKKLNKGISDIVSEDLKAAVSDGDILKRIVYVMINEAARCLEEKVVERSQTVDIGMIMGTGFPPFRAGLLRYADTVGADNIAKDLKSFEEKYKVARFKPSNYLNELAKNNQKFYG